MSKYVIDKIFANKYFFDLGLKFVDTAEHSTAIKAFNICINIDPKNYDAYLAKGILLMELGKFFEAHTCFSKAFKFTGRAEALEAKNDATELYRKYEKDTRAFYMGKNRADNREPKYIDFDQNDNDCEQGYDADDEADESGEIIIRSKKVTGDIFDFN